MRTLLLPLSCMVGACQLEYGYLSDLEAPGSPGVADTGELVEDVFVQAVQHATDVLFVVDNSRSMEDEQARLGANFEAFLDVLLESDTDFHVGVVSTDMEAPDQSGRLQEAGGYRWIEPSTPDPERWFAQMVALGIDGSRDERGRDAAYQAIAVLGDTANAGFVREDAGLHIIVVSDEDDASTLVTVDAFAAYLQALETEGRETSFSSVVGPEQARLDRNRTCALEYGARYVAVTDTVGGTVTSICDADWSEALTVLGETASALRTRFTLSDVPDPDTIVVTIVLAATTLRLESGTGTFLYDAETNTVTLMHVVPPDGSVIRPAA